jgi:hypothetical protein
MKSSGTTPKLRCGVTLSFLLLLSLTPTSAQSSQNSLPFSPGISEFSPLPMPRLPREPVIPNEPPILNPEVASRYFINVADYGAKTGTAFDDTSAIQAALDAACNPDFITEYYITRPVLFFPPGLYQIYQPQLPSTNSPLNIPCTVEIEGSGFTTGAQFSELAHDSQIYVNGGPNPNAAATMTFSPYVHAIIRSMLISGVNQAVAIYAIEPNLFEDVCLTSQATGMPDNTPLKVTDSFWVFYRGGCLQNQSDGPVAIFTAETLPSSPGAEQVVGLVYMSDLITSGGGFKYIQRVPSNGPVPGSFVFRNITMEEAPDAFEITQEFTGDGQWRMSSLTFDNVATADSTCNTCAVINMNAPDLLLSGVLVHNSFAGEGNLGPAIRVNSGLLEDHYVDACAYSCSSSVLDANGDPVWTYTGRVVLSGGTKTLQFYPIFFHDFPPVCVPNDETTINGARITTTLTSMTISGGTSDIVDYACFTNNPYGDF